MDREMTEKDGLLNVLRDLSRIFQGKKLDKELNWQQTPKGWDHPHLKWKNPTSTPKDTRGEIIDKINYLVSKIESSLLDDDMLHKIELVNKKRLDQLVKFILFEKDCKNLQRAEQHLKNTVDFLNEPACKQRKMLIKERFENMLNILSCPQPNTTIFVSQKKTSSAKKRKHTETVKFHESKKSMPRRILPKPLAPISNPAIIIETQLCPVAQTAVFKESSDQGKEISLFQKAQMNDFQFGSNQNTQFEAFMSNEGTNSEQENCSKSVQMKFMIGDNSTENISSHHITSQETCLSENVCGSTFMASGYMFDSLDLLLGDVSQSSEAKDMMEQASPTTSGPTLENLFREDFVDLCSVTPLSNLQSVKDNMSDESDVLFSHRKDSLDNELTQSLSPRKNSSDTQEHLDISFSSPDSGIDIPNFPNSLDINEIPYFHTFQDMVDWMFK